MSSCPPFEVQAVFEKGTLRESAVPFPARARKASAGGPALGNRSPWPKEPRFSGKLVISMNLNGVVEGVACNSGAI